ncbi:interferon-induced very large GTPase 1-like [Lytechinus variegatus]|uniref:interferon-induced very large GTPase 1-like n=1 Tax=Lytechinus variegatus TaxID=7654 RepID=UPI001BB2BF5B|nr:interferon-induced very large GTPase 1-like [Lytechinus variegatus]
MDQLTDTDLRDVTHRANLDHTQLRQLFTKLHIEEALIKEEEERKGDTSDLQLQAFNILRSWRKTKGQNATGRTVCEALQKCGYSEALELLVKKWDLNFQEKTPDTRSELNEMLLQAGLEVDYWVGILKTKLDISLPQQIQYLGETELKVLNDSVRQEWEKNALESFIGIKIEATSSQAEKTAKPDIFVRLAEAGLDAEYWAEVLKKKLGITKMKQSANLKIDDFNKLKAEVRHDGEESTLRHLFCIHNKDSEVFMGERQKQYKEKLEQTKILLQDLVKLRKIYRTQEDIHHTDDTMNQLLDQLRELMSVTKEEWLEKYDSKGLDCIISEISSDLEKIGKLNEGRPKNSAAEILENASAGLALKGILVGEAFRGDLVKRTVLSTPSNVSLKSPLMIEVEDVATFSTKAQSDHFHCSLDNMGYSAAATMKGSGWGFKAEPKFSEKYEKGDKQELESHKQSHFESRVIYSVVPTAACQLNLYSLKLSQRALQELKAIDRLLVGTENVELVNKKCEDFLTAYGSHINAGVLHFGGLNKFVATYTSETEANRAKTKCMVRDALSSYVSGSFSSFTVGDLVFANQMKTHDSFKDDYEKSELAKTTLQSCRKGGPGGVSALALWKIGLGTCTSSWALIDRGMSLFTDFVGIWQLIPNHQGDFQEPLELESCLRAVWERMSGYPVSNDQERSFMKGLEEMDLLIEKIAKWNSSPILPEKCIEYLQEMLKKVDLVRVKTGTNKYWEHKLCTETNIIHFLGNVVELKDMFAPSDVTLIRVFMKKLMNTGKFGEFPGQKKIMEWAEAITVDVPTILAEVNVKSIPDLLKILKERFIPVLEIEHLNNAKKNVQVTDDINAGATVDLALCIDQLQKNLSSSGEEHGMFFLKVALLTIHYHWPTKKFEMLLTVEMLHDFVKFIEVSWEQFLVYKEKGIVQLEAFLIHTLLSSGSFDERVESLEDKFSEAIKEFRQVLSAKLNMVLNRYTTRSPFNWIDLTNITRELANGTMSASKEKEVTIIDLQIMANSKDRETVVDERSVVRTSPGVELQSDFSGILNILGLNEYYPSKISLLDAITIRRVTERINLVDIPWMIMRKLLMIDFHARDLVSSEVNKPSREEMIDDEGDCDLEALVKMQSTICGENKPTQLSTLDVIVATFICCDNCLKQTLAQKLFICKLAIPFFYHMGSEDNIGMSLWALRTINVQWHDTENGSLETPVTEKPFPVVSFVRLDRPTLSKSKLINDILRDDSHDTFFHHDCSNGNADRMISDGLVECSWFVTTGKEKEHLPGTTMLLNLRGDASLMKKQLKILQEISSVLFVIANAQDLTKPSNVETCQQILLNGGKVILLLMMHKDNKQFLQEIRACHEAVGRDILKGVPIISSNTLKGAQKNASELKSEARGKLTVALAGSPGILMEECAKRASKIGIIIDEYDDQACTKGKDLAKEVASHMKGNDIDKYKGLLLPLQGTEWVDYCRLLKRQHRSSGKGSQSYQQDMDRLRKKQVQICNELTPFIKEFMSNLQKQENVVMYFLKWMNLFLDEKSRGNLPGLRKQYHMVWTEYQKCKKEEDDGKLRSLKSQMDEQENRLSSASLGLENLFRELGQIYEAVTASGKVNHDTKTAVEYLPVRAAELLLKGIPLELVDGDASSVPIVWVRAVLSKLGDILGEKRLFVLSVLGIQSSGKSTLLNTMFGLQFAVSAGRCTRGAYMQLIPVDGAANLPFDYVAVVDTEGLRAPELGQLKYEHDNELATLVIGMGDVTMINVKGENTAEIKDILQIAVHAFLRMNLVRKNIRDNRTCIFVHQNVPAANAEDMMMHGCQKLQENLDEMAKEAALSENIADIKSFSQIINFDVQKHVWYFSDLWHGNPPMAPSNPGYSEKVDLVRVNLLGEIANGQTFLTAPELSIRIADLWNGVLADDFVFSFRNSLEVKAYNSLQSQYYTLEWELENELKSWSHAAEITLRRCETIESLEESYRSLNFEILKVLTEKAEELKKRLNDYFENGDLQDIIVQWRESKLNQMNFAVDQHLSEGKADLLSVKEARRVEILQDKKWSEHESYIMSKAVDLADKLKGKQVTDTELQKQFDSMWASIVHELATKTADKELRMDHVMKEILHKRFNTHECLLNSELQRHPLDIPFEHTSLEKSVTIDFVGTKHISLEISYVKKYFTGASGPEGDARNKTLAQTSRILTMISTYVKGLPKHDVKFQKYYATDVIQKIVEGIDIHDQKAQACTGGKFKIRPEYIVKLAVHVSRYCVQVFNSMQSEYNKRHGVKAKLQNYRNTAWSLFKNKVKQSTEEVMAGDLLCTQLKGIVNDAVKKAVPRKCTDEVLRDFQMTKYYLMIKIMDDLAEKGNFQNYKSYIRNAKDFALKWITHYTNEKMFSKQSANGMSRYEEITKIHIIKIMECIINSVHHATDEVRGKSGVRMIHWIRTFCQRVSDEIAVPYRTLTLVRGRSVADFNNLERILLKQLGIIKADLEGEFSLQTADSVEWDEASPPQQILDKLWGCPEQCPFCKEPCADTTPDHYERNERSHMCVQHRPQGIGGLRWERDGKIDGVSYKEGQLVHETCNYDVQRNTVAFKCSVGNYKCRKSGKCSTTGDESVGHNFKEYKTYIPDWDIAPKPTNDVSKYWAWFMAKYQHQLKDMHSAELPDIPEGWTKITKAEALADLREVHH